MGGSRAHRGKQKQSGLVTTRKEEAPKHSGMGDGGRVSIRGVGREISAERRKLRFWGSAAQPSTATWKRDPA